MRMERHGWDRGMGRDGDEGKEECGINPTRGDSDPQWLLAAQQLPLGAWVPLSPGSTAPGTVGPFGKCPDPKTAQGSTEGYGWRWAPWGGGELGWQGQRGTGKMRASREGGGELGDVTDLGPFTLRGADRFNFQSTAIKVMDGGRSSRAGPRRLREGLFGG